MIRWYNVVAVARADNLDQLEQCLWDLGAVSVTCQDEANQPLYEPGPGETPMWPIMSVTGLIEAEDFDQKRVTEKITRAGFTVQLISEVQDKIWEREWLTRFSPMQFGRRLWVCPTGQELPDQAGRDAVTIRLDPGLAFGTGTHETTRLCLEHLDTLNLTDATVIDYGCGSGVLGVAAALLGAANVICIDNDPQALTATRENAERNEVALDAYMVGKSLPKANVVLANILAQPLIELSDILLDCLAPQGVLILSGIMSSQNEWVRSHYGNYANSLGIELSDTAELNGWVRMVWHRS